LICRVLDVAINFYVSFNGSFYRKNNGSEEVDFKTNGKLSNRPVALNGGSITAHHRLM
jgi:hypothetical protein